MQRLGRHPVRLDIESIWIESAIAFFIAWDNNLNLILCDERWLYIVKKNDSAKVYDSILSPISCGDILGTFKASPPQQRTLSGDSVVSQIRRANTKIQPKLRNSKTIMGALLLHKYRFKNRNQHAQALALSYARS